MGLEDAVAAGAADVAPEDEAEPCDDALGVPAAECDGVALGVALGVGVVLNDAPSESVGVELGVTLTLAGRDGVALGDAPSESVGDGVAVGVKVAVELQLGVALGVTVTGGEGV